MHEKAELDLAVLQGIVTLAKDGRIYSAQGLIEAALAKGFGLEEVKTAIGFWADNLRARYKDFEQLKLAQGI